MSQRNAFSKANSAALDRELAPYTLAVAADIVHHLLQFLRFVERLQHDMKGSAQLPFRLFGLEAACVRNRGMHDMECGAQAIVLSPAARLSCPDSGEAAPSRLRR